MSCYISSGCNNQPCSQSQKVSIGIVVDSVAKSRRDFMKDAPNHSDQRRVKASTTMTRCGNDVEGSVRVTTALFGNKLETKRSGHGVNPASRPASSSLYVEKPTRITQSFTNQAMPECGVGNKTEGDPTSEKENERVFMEDKAQKFSGAPKQQVCCEGKEMEDRSRETLRMKLREILGTGDKIFGHPRTPEVDVNVMTKKETEKGKTNFKPWQNSDTIETDSENEDSMIRKPVTRSLTRRATLAKKQPSNIKTKSISREKGHVRANIFSFTEKSAISTPCPVKRVCLIAEKNDSKQSFGINAWGKLFPVKNLRNIMPENNGCENAQPAEELDGGGIKPSKHAGLDGNFEPEDAYQDLTSGRSPVARETSQFPLPAPQGKLEHLEPKGDQFRVHNVDDLNRSPVQNVADLNHSPVHNVDKLNQFPVHNVDDFQSPVQNVTDLNHSPVHNVDKLNQFPVHIVDDLNQSPVQNVTDLNHSPVHNVDDLNQSPVHHVNNSNSQRFDVTKNALYSPMYPLTNDKGFHESMQQEGGAGLKAKCCTPSTSSETDISECSDDADKLEDSPSSTLNPSSEENNAGNRLCTPMRRELDSTEEVSSAMKEIDDVHTSPEIRFVGKHMLFQSKRQRNHGVEFDDLSPTLTPKLSGYVDDELLCCEETQEDGMQRVVSLLGLALEKIQNKMMSVTNRKCSEILVSAAEEIHSELQSVDSQIQTDLGKLTDIKTAKRKQLETRLQEQTEHLKAMHEKFKKEIIQYLHDCQGAMEGMKEYHFELQRAIKKQKTLHRKLLLQTEAAVETRLSDAQRQMKIVRKLGKQKIQQLQVVIAECLKDQITY